MQKIVKYHNLSEAIDLALKTQRAKFKETLDVSIKLGIDATKPEQHVKGYFDMPNSIGIKKRVLALVPEDKISNAISFGADYAGEEYISKIQNGWLEFDSVVATPSMMAKIGKIGKTLGTKGIMPNVKFGTISDDLEGMIKSIKSNRVIFKNDKYGLINAPIGKSDLNHDKILENIRGLLLKMLELRPSTSKGQYIRSVSVSLTMGPSFKIDPVELTKELRS